MGSNHVELLAKGATSRKNDESQYDLYFVSIVTEEQVSSKCHTSKNMISIRKPYLENMASIEWPYFKKHGFHKRAILENMVSMKGSYLETWFP